MTYATNRGLVWVLDNVKKRGSGGGSHTSSLTTGLGSGPSSLQLPSGPPMSLTPQGNRIIKEKIMDILMKVRY